MSYRRRQGLQLLAVLWSVAAAVSCRWLAVRVESAFAEKLLDSFREYLYLGLFFLWGVSVRRRILQTQVRQCLEGVSVLMLLWLLVREFKWRFVLQPDLLRFLWYCYYVPQLLIPLLALFVALSLERPPDYRLSRGQLVLLGPTLGLIALVLTNDLHQMVLRFPAGAAVWSEADYTYGPVFYLVNAWGILCALLALLVMLWQARRSRMGVAYLPPSLIFGLTVFYMIAYALRVPFVRSIARDRAVCDCLAFTAFFESGIRCGLIHSNARHQELFRASRGISMQIADREYVVRQAASDTVPVGREEMVAAEAGPVILGDDRLLHNLGIPGGHAVWTEDISTILALRGALEERREELRERGGLLAMEYEREHAHRAVEEQNRLYDRLQAVTRRQLLMVEVLTGDYQRAGDAAGKQRILAEIMVLGSYMKQRKSMALTLEDGGRYPVERLSGALRESFRALSLLGLRGSFHVRTTDGYLLGRNVVRIYDFFEEAAEKLMEGAAAMPRDLRGHLGAQDHGGSEASGASGAQEACEEAEAAARGARYLSVTVTPLGGVLRAALRTERRLEPAEWSAPGIRVQVEEDGSVAILELEDR